MYTGIHLAGGYSLISSIESIIIVYLLPLISIVSTTAVSGDSSLREGPVWVKRNENGSCECGSELGGEIKWGSNKQVVSIMVGYCMYNLSQQLLVGFNHDRCLIREFIVSFIVSTMICLQTYFKIGKIMFRMRSA